MINIITSTNKSGVIRDVDYFFDKYISVDSLTPLMIRAMRNIDSAVLDGGTRVKTPYGITDISHLSTGCKIVLFYLFTQTPEGRVEFGNNILEVTECGGNALVELLRCAIELKDSTSVILLRQSTQIYKLEGIPGMVNGHVCDSLYRGLEEYGEWV